MQRRRNSAGRDSFFVPLTEKMFFPDTAPGHLRGEKQKKNRENFCDLGLVFARQICYSIKLKCSAQS